MLCHPLFSPVGHRARVGHTPRNPVGNGIVSICLFSFDIARPLT